jgi:MFS family permease
MQFFSGPFLMYYLTGSKALLGTMALVSSLPMIFVSLFGGAFADRIKKKHIVIVNVLASAVVSVGIAVALSSGFISPEKEGSWWIFMIAVLITGSLMGMMMPALQALVADIVKREQLMNAVAVNTMGTNILFVIGPRLASYLIDTYGYDSVYYAMAVFYVLSAFFIAFIRGAGPTTPPPLGPTSIAPGKANILGEIQKGFQYIRKEPLILALLAFSLVVTVLSQPYQQLLPIFVEDILKVGTTGGGELMMITGLGALIGSIIITFLPNKKRGLMLIGSGIMAGMALIAFSFSTIWGLSLGTMIFIGFSGTFRMTISTTLLQAYSEPEYRGRVMSIFSMQWGLMSVFTFIAGILSEVVSVQWVLGTLAMLLVVLSILSVLFVPSIRKVE